MAPSDMTPIQSQTLHTQQHSSLTMDWRFNEAYLLLQIQMQQTISGTCAATYKLMEQYLRPSMLGSDPVT